MKKKSNLKKLKIILIAFLFGSLINGITLLAKTLKFSHHVDTGNALHYSAERAAKMLEKRTEGRLKIKIYPNSQLGGEIDNFEALALGTVDITIGGASTLGSVYGPVGISDYPFVLRGTQHWKAYTKSDLFKKLVSEYSKRANGSSIYGVGFAGTRDVTSNIPILKPSDMIDLKVRVPNVKSFTLFPRAVGANPTPLAWSEVYLALQQGVVDAQESTIPYVYSAKIYEVQKYLARTAHILQTVVTVVSGVTLSGMSSSDKKILQEVLTEAADYGTDLVLKEEEEIYDLFRKKGVTVNEVDRKPFSALVAKEMFKDGGKNVPFSRELYDQLQAIPDAK